MIVGKVIFRSHSHFKCRLLSFFVRGNNYCHFECKKILEKSKNKGFVGNVNLMLSDENIGGAMVFLENGILKMLECYFWQENNFFENITNE